MSSTYRSTDLHSAVIAQSESLLLSAIRTNPNDMNMPDSFGSYPLIDAIKLNNVRMAIILLDAGCNPMIFDSTGTSPLSAAWASKNLLIIKRILDILHERHIDINTALDDPDKSLIIADKNNECSAMIVKSGLVDPY